MGDMLERIKASARNPKFRLKVVLGTVAAVVVVFALLVLLRKAMPEIAQRLESLNVGLWLLILTLVLALIVKQFRNRVIGGVLLTIPLFTTAFIFLKAFSWIDSALPSLINKDWGVGFGAVALVITAYFIGLFARNYLGQKMIQLGNAVISNIPIVNKIYLGIQQILDAAVHSNKKLFERPVLIEYPRTNCYCIGFVTAETTGEIPTKVNTEMVSIFLPTTPNPTSGFLLFLPKTDVIDLDMNVETAVKLVMSAGIVNADQLNRTEHLYTLPSSVKGWNWLANLRRGHKQGTSDTHD